MSENTKEEIALILQNNTAWCPQAGCYIIHGAIEKIQEKIDQEKRSTAIAFQEWAADRGWLLHPDCDEDEERAWYKPSDNFDIPDELMFGGQLYDLYLKSLDKTV